MATHVMRAMVIMILIVIIIIIIVLLLMLNIMIVTMINVTVIIVRRRKRWCVMHLHFASLAYSATGTRARVARVRAEYPNQLDYSGCGGTTCSGPYPHMTLWVSACPSLGEQKCFRCEIAGGRETNAATEHVLAQEDKGHREGDI